MNVSNNNVNVQGFNNRTNPRTTVSRNRSIHETKEAVKIMINPRTLSSKEYRDILREKEPHPIINPNVLMYDERLYLRRYLKS